MQAKLPKNLETTGLKDMKDGESAYTLPWAMYADEEGSLWLNGEYPVSEKEEKTSCMLVTKERDWYIVDVSRCGEYTWSKGGGAFLGDFIPLPVSKLIGA
jgi:hypothetical protein